MRLEMSRNISSFEPRAACSRAARAHLLLTPHLAPAIARRPPPVLALLPCTGASLRLRCSAREPVWGIEFGWHVRCECECAVAVASCWLLLFRECLFVLLSCPWNRHAKTNSEASAPHAAAQRSAATQMVSAVAAADTILSIWTTLPVETVGMLALMPILDSISDLIMFNNFCPSHRCPSCAAGCPPSCPLAEYAQCMQPSHQRSRQGQSRCYTFLSCYLTGAVSLVRRLAWRTSQQHTRIDFQDELSLAAPAQHVMPHLRLLQIFARDTLTATVPSQILRPVMSRTLAFSHGCLLQVSKQRVSYQMSREEPRFDGEGR